jgi:hypothetical protein
MHTDWQIVVYKEETSFTVTLSQYQSHPTPPPTFRFIYVFPEMTLHGTAHFQNKITLYCSVSQFTHSCICEWFIYSQDRSAEDRSWEYKNGSQIHECRNWERDSAVSFLGIYVSQFGTVCIENYNYSLKISIIFGFYLGGLKNKLEEANAFYCRLTYLWPPDLTFSLSSLCVAATVCLSLLSREGECGTK